MAGLTVLYDSIIYYANDAKNSFAQGAEQDAFERLEQIVRTISVLKDFKSKYDMAARNGGLPHSLPQLTPVPETPIEEGKSRKRARTSKEEAGNHNQSRRHSIATPPLTTPIDTDLPQESSSQLSPFDDEGPGPGLLLPMWTIDPELCAQLDEVFFAFLAKVCSDLEITDEQGEKIHQTLIARKMSKITESPEFHPFKFRIRSFTNAFRSELYRSGFTEEMIPERKVKQYLWQQRYISRFNEDGRKAKSKGSHVWVVEARKTADGGWIFKEFERRITGVEPNPVAYVGVRYGYEPKVYDPQIKSPKVVFHSPWLPPWLRWEDNVLTGVPTPDARNCSITVLASYFHGETSFRLEKQFYLTITTLPPSEEDDRIMIGGTEVEKGGHHNAGYGYPYGVLRHGGLVGHQ
ncbi:hypothetical protein HK097_003338 [Rhizophlyctis rosea]|uniref:Uncharacterized protein n=1 Tax=Rhizophlyctis rosea TaxID=64517 RepID=A0AAD5S3C2_9FUNG|nr:hypothetical protein HK097_003338 [Rhizophlyctis rosea]